MQKPVLIAISSHRTLQSGVILTGTTSVASFAANEDEALGKGVRLGRQQWPALEGWAVADVAICWVSREYLEEALGTFPKAPEPEAKPPETSLDV